METVLDQNSVQFNDLETLKKKNREITDSLRQQRRINRANIADAKVNNIVSGAADKQGIDINTPYSYPVTDDFGKNLVDTLANHVSEEDKPKLSTFISSIPSPNYIAPPTINIDEEKAKAKLQRKVRWADALYAFGEGMQGKTANKDVMGSTKLQRERDTNFQNFKLISEANKKTAKDWEVNSRKEALDWIDKQLASDVLSEAERKKYQLAYDQLKQQGKQHADEIALQKERIDPTVARGTVGINGREYDYNLKASDIPDLSSKAKADSEFLNQHPEFFVEYRVGDTVDEDGNKKPVTERKLNISDVDLALAYKNRFSRTRVVPLNQIPLSPEGYRTQEQFKAKQTGQQIATPVNNSPEQAIDDFFK